MRRWVVASSPRYGGGVVIDAATGDHVLVLVRLCLNAAAAEACRSLETERVRSGEEDGGSGFGDDPRELRFECPRLVEGVVWLGAQLRILYGEGSGRLFAIAAVREAILRAGSRLVVGVGGSGEGGEAGASGGESVQGSDFGNVGTSSVYVSQVAAAVAALHERFSLEEKIKALRAPRRSKYQLYTFSILTVQFNNLIPHTLERGHEERLKRPNYRTILEYDGVISRQVDSQESGRAKTREELLAEERDYKRRRMSYRGKKLKRNPKEILRDIIDEHMEEIKHAGGIGCLVDTPGGIALSMLKDNSHEGTHQGSFDPTSSSYSKEVLGHQSASCAKSTCDDTFGIVSSRNHGMRDSVKDLRNGNRQREYQKVSDHDNRRINDSESTVDQRYSHQHENSRRQRNSNDHRKYDYKYKKDGSDYYSESSGCTRGSSEREYGRMSGVRSNDISTASHTRHRSVSVIQDQFSDRYNPQSAYSDRDPATIMLYEGSAGQREIYHDEKRNVKCCESRNMDDGRRGYHVYACKVDVIVLMLKPNGVFRLSLSWTNRACEFSVVWMQPFEVGNIMDSEVPGIILISLQDSKVQVYRSAIIITVKIHPCPSGANAIIVEFTSGLTGAGATFFTANVVVGTGCTL
uniref:Uncharacterized protein n=1 Tax=Leersia perrieri TaxID=77586 RepID=A0A0D9W3P4_9ORYZ